MELYCIQRNVFLKISDSILEVFAFVLVNTLLPIGLEVVHVTLYLFWSFLASILVSFHPVPYPISMY
jgi:hypothetical protein